MGADGMGLFDGILDNGAKVKLVRKHGKRNTLAIPLADGNLWVVCNEPFKGGVTSWGITTPTAETWLVEMIRNIPIGKRISGLGLKGKMKITTHAFTTGQSDSRLAERIMAEAVHDTGLPEPTTPQEAQAKVDAEWPVFLEYAEEAGLTLTVREIQFTCDLSPCPEDSDKGLNDIDTGDLDQIGDFGLPHRSRGAINPTWWVS